MRGGQVIAEQRVVALADVEEAGFLRPPVGQHRTVFQKYVCRLTPIFQAARTVQHPFRQPEKGAILD